MLVCVMGVMDGVPFVCSVMYVVFVSSCRCYLFV